MNQYTLILRDDPEALARISPSEMEAIVARYVRWREDNATHVTGGEKLADGTGLVLRRRGGAGLEVSDGPFIEAKEVLGGFFFIRAESLDAARGIAETCPHLEFGSIELRLVDPTD